MPKVESTRVTRQARQRPAQPPRTAISKGKDKAVARRPAPKTVGTSKTKQQPKKSGKLNMESIFAASYAEGHVSVSPKTPEFSAAYGRLMQAWTDSVPAGQETPVYSEVYSYLPGNCRIPQGTPVAPGIPGSSRGGTTRSIVWSEDMMNEALKAEFGDVALGKNFVRQMATICDVVGGLPESNDPSIRYVPIPGRTYHIRLWTGRMDQTRAVCWNFMCNKTKQPRLRPSNLQIYAISGPARVTLKSIEEGHDFDLKKSQWAADATETFCASDGAVIDLVVNKKIVLRLQLPARPTAGPPRIKKYREYKSLPFEQEEDVEEEDEEDEEEKDNEENDSEKASEEDDEEDDE
ncbi:hypothetical protein BD626DRAFT_489294 [Schizophyllum amplum]|uniref:Uncharacterized protein n=1 Tax=Schizophyllum amplum TaxID=97359 RepID=A0A550CLA5_9AGAR|nr:hypothetical protein BD626DRAFT_489294 [Auriculariopsis ampla]